MNNFIKVYITLLLLFFPFTYSTVNAQKAKNKNKKTARSAVRKPVQKSQNKRTITPLVRKPFEGELLYVSYENHSKTILKFSCGMAYNGERTKLVTVKGNLLDMYDRSMQYHTTLDGDKKTVVLWSDVTKMALHFDWSFLALYLNVLGPEPNPLTPNVAKHSTMRDSGSTTYKGDELRILKGQQVIDGGGKYDVEFWYSQKYIVPDCYRYVNWGAPVDGIVKKWVYTYDGAKTPVGELYGTAAMELVSVYEHSVLASAFEVPDKYKHVYKAENKDLLKFYKNLAKQLMKRKEYPSDDYELAKLSITESWPFTSSWMANAKKSKTSTWEIIQQGMNLFSTVLSGVTQNNMSVSEDGGDMGVPSGKSESYYLSQYNMWKNKAINSLRSGVKHKTQGKLSGDGGYSRMGRADAKYLRTIQQHMRWIRQAAAKEGFHIPQSEYENSAP